MIYMFAQFATLHAQLFSPVPILSVISPSASILQELVFWKIDKYDQWLMNLVSKLSYHTLLNIFLQLVNHIYLVVSFRLSSLQCILGSFSSSARFRCNGNIFLYLLFEPCFCGQQESYFSPYPSSFIKTFLEVEGPDLFFEDDPRSNFLETTTFASPVCPLLFKRD